MTENQAPIQLVGKLPARGAIEEWSHEDRESAFWIYCDPHQGNRSLRKTGRITGIPFQTLSRWNVNDEWQMRLWEQDQRVAAAVKQSVQMRLVNELDSMMDGLIELTRTGTNYDKVRLDAIKLGLGIASFSEVKKVEADIVTNDITSPKRAKGGSNELKETKSVKELAEKLNAKLAAYSTEDGEDS